MDASWEALGHQNGLPNRLLEPSWHLLDIVSPSFDLKVSPRERLGSLLGASWEPLGRLLGVLGTLLGGSWQYFGAFLEHF